MLRNKLPVFITTALFLTAGLVVNCADDDNGNGNGGTNSTVETIQNESDLSTLFDALETAGLANTIEELESVTVFAPTNDAFDALPADTLDSLLADTARLRDILLYHVTDTTLTSSDLDSNTAVSTVQGEDINVTTENGNIILNGTAQVIDPDIDTKNGVVHKIDALLLPGANGGTPEDPTEDPTEDPAEDPAEEPTEEPTE